jgi:hypothetical protein
MTRSRSVAWATMIAIAGTLSTPFSVSAAPVAATAADACARQQGFYLRRNKLDISIYNASIDASAAEGAAISYTGDRENDTDTAEVHAVAAWVFARNPCSPIGEPPIGRPYVSGYAFAASVLGDGTLTADRTDEKSALKPGLDAQIEIANWPLFPLQALTATPYYQTDLRGEAQAYGFSASWQPYNLDWRLGGNYFRFSRPFDFFYQVKLEADGLRVNNPGLTSLTADTDYLWIGGTATLRASLFNGLLGWDRLTWVTSYTYFDDTNSSRDSSKNSSQNIHLFTTNLAYNFTESGKTSISVEYQNGTNRDTLEKLNQYLVTLNVKY